ncbi:MAG: HAMP domain-containing histidine kinase [Treponema sp.]|jgi:signal transduction histidine kinase|nr:HAMP domain-containing histidine kinase [Treponema sp.]
MKIQSQFYLLILGIIMVPILSIVSQIFFLNFQERKEQAEDEIYNDTLLAEYVSLRGRESIARFAARSNAGIVVFRDDLLVLYSNIGEFKTGVSGTTEKIFSLIAAEKEQYSYTFESPAWLESHEYILVRRPVQPAGQPRPPPFPIFRTMPVFLVLVAFAAGMSLSIARSITKSVLVLENATRRIAAGELDLAVNVRGSNEITSLTSSLNQMRAALKEDENRRYRFIMGVTHDLKTPLALIKGYSEAIKDGITDDPSSRIKATDIIISKADQLEAMINDLIEFVRMDTGEWRGRLQKVNGDEFFKSFARRISSDAELFRHPILVDIALPGSLYIPLDERLVIRALENIVNNAIRYTPEGTLIRFTAALVENTLRVSISDRGPGIDKNDLPHIFEIFYRGNSSRQEEGMGLGLAIVKWVVDSHGWSIAVRSEQGGEDLDAETCFTITIPLPREAQDPGLLSRTSIPYLSS